MNFQEFDVCEAKHSTLAADLSYFWQLRNETVGISFDTEFLFGLKKYTFMSMVKESDISLQVKLIEATIKSTKEKIITMIDSAQTEEEKRKVFKETVRLNNVLKELVKQFNSLVGE